MFGGKVIREYRGKEASVHQRPQESPNEMETTNTSLGPTSFSPPTLNLQRRRRKENFSLVCMFFWLYQIRCCLCSAGAQMKAQALA